MKSKNNKYSDTKLALLLMMPAAVLVIGLYFIPTLITFLMSFQKKDISENLFEVIMNIPNSTLDNYIRSFRDPDWIASLNQTMLLILIVTGLGIVISLGIAILLSQEFKGRGLIRTLVLIPWAVPPIVNGTTWTLIYHPQVGTLNALLNQLGIIDRYLIWFIDPLLAIFAAGLAITWRFIPFMTLFILAGLQTVQKELYESAMVDGANFLRRFIHITLPAIRPVLLTVIFMQIIWTTKVFDEIWALIKGGAAGTTVMNLWVYRQAFEFLRYGYGSALAYLLALFTSVIVIAYYYFVSKRSER
ncbi:MAG: sugar ABC transporter permease [Thermoproteota archaeon]